MSLDRLLSHLSKVKKTGHGSYLARCPSHDDKNPSLAVREIEDGRILVHCFAGCGVEEILNSVGLEFDSLYPEKPIDHVCKPERYPFSPKDILEAVKHESLIVSVAASILSRKEALNEDDFERLMLANRRIQTAGDLYE
jgi:hypothetical protein